MQGTPDPGDFLSIHSTELSKTGTQSRAGLHCTVTEEIPASPVQLGCFIVNPKEPFEGYYDPLPDRPTARELTTVIQHNYEEIFRASGPIVRSYINNIFSIFHKDYDTGVTTLRTPQVTTYKLCDSKTWFRDAYSRPETREFLKEKIREGSDIYLIVGLRVGRNVTITHGPTVANNIGASSSRPVDSTTIDHVDESVFAIQYRKLKLKWSLYQKIDSISLNTYVKWRILHNERETGKTSGKPSNKDKQGNSIPKNEENNTQEAHASDTSDSDTSVEVDLELSELAFVQLRPEYGYEDKTYSPENGPIFTGVPNPDSGISGCEGEGDEDCREDEIDRLEEKHSGLTEAKESSKQVQAISEPSVREGKRRAHPQPATTQNTGPDTIGNFIANELTHLSKVSTSVSLDVSVVNPSSGSLPLPSNSYIPPSEPFPPMCRGQINDDSATSMNSWLTTHLGLEDEPGSHKLLESNSSTPIHQHVLSAYSKPSPTSHSSITPLLHSSHTSSPDRSAEGEEESPKAHPETLAPAKSPTPTYQNFAQGKEADSVAHEAPRAALSHTLLGSSRHLEAASWATLEDMRIQAGSQAASVLSTESGRGAKAEPKPVFCKRAASWFEDTMWSTKYMISRLEFSIMKASDKRSEAFPTRVSWKCACNTVIFDDFLELAPGCSESAIPSNSGVQQHSNTSNARGSFLSSLLPTPAKWSFGGKGVSPRPSGALPSSTAQTSNSSSSTQINNHANKDRYLLLCYNNRWDSIRLLHLDIPPSKKDQELFANIRHAYYTARGWWRCLFSLKVLRHIEFVKFELYYVEDVDISARNDLPGPAAKHYEYLPRPAKTIPPVGPNAFMHFFHNPEHAPTLDHLINRMPKKVDGRVKIEADASTEFGWGVHFIERFSRIRIFILASFLLFICLLLGILWTVIRNDIQGGFGVAGFLAAALAVFISIMCVQIVVY